MRPIKYHPLSDAVIQDILSSNPKPQTEEPGAAESEKSNPSASSDAPLTLHFDCHYDSMEPVEHIREFVKFTKDVIFRYEEDERQVTEFDQQTQDILHYIELGDNLNAIKGFEMYRMLRDIRRRRRECKNELSLLKPIYNFCIENKSYINSLTQIQGECASAKKVIDSRCYTMRTKVLERRETVDGDRS